jgi:hypothetical protein
MLGSSLSVTVVCHAAVVCYRAFPTWPVDLRLAPDHRQLTSGPNFNLTLKETRTRSATTRSGRALALANLKGGARA